MIEGQIPPQTPIVITEETSTDEEMPAYEDSDWDSLAYKRWFWGYMNRGDTEKKLYNEGNMGDFIIRLNASKHLVMSLWYVPIEFCIFNSHFSPQFSYHYLQQAN